MSYLEKIDAAPAGERWPMVRRWMREEPLALYDELRAERPVIDLGDVILATRHADCTNILARHDLFSVEPYESKQGLYWMAQDDTARHWREKGIMRAVLDFEAVPETADWAETETRARLDTARGGEIDVVAEITRGVPLAMVERFFGFEEADTAALFEWSYWNQMDAFWNQPFDDPQFATAEEIVARREAANEAMREYLTGLVTRRAAALQAGERAGDAVSRLLVLAGSGALRFDVPLAVLNIGGLLIGAVETTSHAAVNAIREITADSTRLQAALSAMKSGEGIEGYVWEALRFRPAFPYFFRRAEADTVLGSGTSCRTEVSRGRMVLAVTHSAMFDRDAVEHPCEFDPSRGLRGTFTFGYGLHECLGRAIGAALVPAIVRGALSREGVRRGEIDYRGGPVPESWIWSVEDKSRSN